MPFCIRALSLLISSLAFSYLLLESWRLFSSCSILFCVLESSVCCQVRSKAPMTCSVPPLAGDVGAESHDLLGKSQQGGWES